MTTRQKEIIGIACLILFIFIYVLWCTTDIFPLIKRVEYTETPQQRAQIEKRMRYHGLGMNGVEVMRECGESWCFYRGGEWVRL